MKKYYALLIVLAACIAVACNPGEGTGDSNEKILSVEPTLLEFAASGNSSQELNVTAKNVEWTHSVSASAVEWITVTPDGSKLIVTVTDNPTAEQRTGTITVKPVDDVTVKSIGVIVNQEAGTGGEEYSITVTPATLTFEGEDADPQEVRVEVSSPDLEWSVAPEEGASWVHAARDGDKIVVTVDDNPITTPRAAMLIVTPDNKSASPKSVKVEQTGRIVLPSLTVTPDNLTFDYKGEAEKTLSVTAVDVEWGATTADEEGNTVSWLHALVVEANMAVVVSVDRNDLLEPRSGYVVVTSKTAGVPDVKIKVEQEAGVTGLGNLARDIDVTDMSPAGGLWATIYPAQMWDNDVPCTSWSLEFWSDGLTCNKNSVEKFVGTGFRIAMDFYSERIQYNYDEEFSIPTGEYTITRNTSTLLADNTPFTIEWGQETNNLNYPAGAWYTGVEDGVYTEYAPLVDGKMTVEKDDAGVYTFTLDFVDDLDNAITGTFSSEITDLEVWFFEENDPNQNPNPGPDPNPDPDFPTE